MNIRNFALGGAFALTSLVTLSPAFAFTHHPATPAEIKQTDDLNAQALAQAKGSEGGMTNASSGTVNGGMNTGASMNVGGTDENGNANTSTNGNVAPPKPNPGNATPNTTPPNNGQ